MKEKITITIEVNKIDKNKITTRTYQNSQGETVTVKELKLDIVPLNDVKLIKDGDTYQLLKTHFVAEQQTKEEREAKIKSKIIGQGVMFKNKYIEKKVEEDIMPETEEIDDNDIPF